MHLSPHEFDRLRTLIRGLCGLSLGEEKDYLIHHRLEPVVQAAGLRSYAELADRLARPSLTDGPLRDQVIAAITTGETSFFRDGHPFETFRERLLPELLGSLPPGRAAARPVRLRFWSAACSTGQEPYTIAVAVQEFLGTLPPHRGAELEFEILATDVSTTALAGAEAGRYTDAEAARGLNAVRRDRYFRRADARHWEPTVELRRLITFRRLNLIEPWPAVGVFDGVFCRNVMIYFDEELRRQVVSRLSQTIRPEGFLMLGASESPPRGVAGLTPRLAGATSLLTRTP